MASPINAQESKAANSLQPQQVPNNVNKLHVQISIVDKMQIKRIHEILSSVWETLVQVGRDDPRRVVFALKVGTALTAVSLLCYLGPLYEIFAQNAMWAIMTIVLVLEFTAGATLYKGFNRGLGTLSAGLLALFILFIALKAGRTGKFVVVATAIFVIGSGATFVRFVPYIKKNYDYGVLIFLLTFNLIIIPTFHVDRIFDMAWARLYTILLGCGICLIVSLLILPNWSGQDLEKSTIHKLEILAESVEACVNDYFKEEEIREEEKASKYSIYRGYRTVLESKAMDETQALFASWEPRHSRHRYPCEEYVKLGIALRHFAYTVGALHGCLESEIQAPQSLRSQFKEPSILLAAEVSKVLMTLAISIKKHQLCTPKVLSTTLHEVLHHLDASIKCQPRLFLGPQREKAGLSSTLLHMKSRRVEEPPKESTTTGQQKVLSHQLSKIVISTLEFSDALPLAAFVSMIVEMIARLDLVIMEVEELGKNACFRNYSNQENQMLPSKKPPGTRSGKLQGHVVPQMTV